MEATRTNRVRTKAAGIPTLLLLAALAGLAPDAAASHDQEGLTFQSEGGNEWWVELQTTGDLTYWWGPYVRDTGGEWKAMEHPSWAPNDGFFATSYHVEPGHMVQFRFQAFKSTNFLLSCWFTHPGAVESCDGTENFTATFSPSGHGERIGVRVTATQNINVVYAKPMPDGWFIDLPKRSDGTWARDIHVPEGIIFKFFTESADSGEFFESGCFRWPSTASATCPVDEYSIGFDPRPVDGDWTRLRAQYIYWPNAPTGMQVRWDGGEFADMRLEDDRFMTYEGAPSSGSHILQFRGLLPNGKAYCRADGYVWPYSGSYAPSLGAGGNAAVFRDQKGSTGWVQTNVFSQTGIFAVEAQVNGGPWMVLTKQTYCDWTRAMSAPEGSSVNFRAFFPNLGSLESGPMTWPPGSTPSPQPFDATFTLVKGNEWWVQTAVTPKAEIAKVDVRLNGGTWKALTLQSWGDWAASYHIPEGTIVQFRATDRNGATDLSSCYRWIPPQTGGQDASPIACPTGTFTAGFSNVKGNNWWVEAKVTANQPLSGVDARVNCQGEWKPLTLRSWGAWAASFNIPTGAKVDLRARSTTGAAVLSNGYIWPQAEATSPC